MKERRKRRSAKDIKESIINAATHLIETEGFSNLTVTGIMRQAEIEPVQFYYIFRSIPVHFPAAY